jgi:ABC-type bacteriocin/lantibiotic exporter with double-glycine peptidase domain
MATMYLVLLLVISPPLGLLVLGLGAVQAAATIAARRSNQRLTTEMLEAEARSESYAYQLLAGIEDLKAPAPRTGPSLTGRACSPGRSRSRLTGGG